MILLVCLAFLPTTRFDVKLFLLTFQVTDTTNRTLSSIWQPRKPGIDKPAENLRLYGLGGCGITQDLEILKNQIYGP